MSSLSSDVLELIFDEFAEDIGSLSRFSLLARATLEPAQRRLFNTIDITKIDRNGIRNLVSALESNKSLLSYIKTLSWDVDAPFECSDTLPNLKTLTINPKRYRRYIFWDSLPITTQTTVEVLLQSPQLKDLFIGPFHGFPLANLLGSANLEALHMESCHPLIVNEWSETYPSLSHRLRGPSQIRRFTLAHIWKLEISDFDWHGWNRLVGNICRDSVEEISLGLNTRTYSQEFIHYDLGNMVNLRWATFLVYIPGKRLPSSIVLVLKTLPKEDCALKYLCIDIEYDNFVFDLSLCKMNWERVDEILCTLPNFRELHINARHARKFVEDIKMLGDIEKTKLPRLFSQGRLSVSLEMQNGDRDFYLQTTS
ncbi:hypothetical protein DXG01_014372 [Tephrocybe rancida]|nr:hypothetical protein DXG01_014372 [Tephrocybe rancida]